MSVLTEEQRKLFEEALQERREQQHIFSRSNSQAPARVGNKAPRFPSTPLVGNATKHSKSQRENGAEKGEDEVGTVLSGKARRKTKAKRAVMERISSWGAFLDAHGEYAATLDPQDPNYSSGDDAGGFFGDTGAEVEAIMEYKQRIQALVGEYFLHGITQEVAWEVGKLSKPAFAHYLVKRIITCALDRGQREREMGAILLSELYGSVIGSEDMKKGFQGVIEAIEDISIDVPDAPELIAIFLSRAVVDDILPPAFLTQLAKGVEDEKAEKSLRSALAHLSAPLAAVNILRAFGGEGQHSISAAKGHVKELLKEFVTSRDRQEAVRCLRELDMSFFHHELVKQSLILAMEEESARKDILNMLHHVAEIGLVSETQVLKGFQRVQDSLPDLELDIPNARELLHKIIHDVKELGMLAMPWAKIDLEANGTQNGNCNGSANGVDDKHVKVFKEKCTVLLREYLLSGDVDDACLRVQEIAGQPHQYWVVKRAVTLSMDMGVREKEAVAHLLFELKARDILDTQSFEKGFGALLDSTEDLTLDIPDTPGVLALFIARAVIDDLIPSTFVTYALTTKSQQASGEVAKAASVLLKGQNSRSRVKNAWGGSDGASLEHAKQHLKDLLAEYVSSRDSEEAIRCLRELDMPFFHHEFVKQALILAMEAPPIQLPKDVNRWPSDDRNVSTLLLDLLTELAETGQLSLYQITVGFQRVRSRLNDLSLDIPDAVSQYERLCSALSHTLTRDHMTSVIV
mmetsp:Transcript_8232/g.30367  ORF Transcript_8232/g.30367 Transcript_8232/m.30367 type:complete len:745 (-) Transcript_8232:1201-3435(-)|eukprot:scaffold1766_cov401-Prasinococcus_capsulatus_cf.AAC.19